MIKNLEWIEHEPSTNNWSIWRCVECGAIWTITDDTPADKIVACDHLPAGQSEQQKENGGQ